MSWIKNMMKRGNTAVDEIKGFTQKMSIQKGMVETEDEITRKQELGSIYEFGHDEGAELLQEFECIESQTVQIVNDEGKAILDDKGQPVFRTEDKILHHNAAMRVHNSPRHQWRVLEQADIDIAGLSMRLAYLKRLASMRRDEYNTGKASFYQAIETNAKLNLCDSRKGNKFRIINTRRSEVTYGEIPKEKKMKVF